MSETLEADVVQEVVTPEQEQVADVPQEAVAPVPEEPKEDPQEKNWRAARLKMEEQAHQLRLLQQELESVRRQQAPKAPEPEPEEEYLTDSERKLAAQIKELRKMVNQNQAKESDYMLDRLRSKYADFDEVMSPENITYLQTNNAALARAIASLKDNPYEQGLAAYDALKNTDWYKQRHTMEDKARMDANAKKPMSVQAVRKQGPLAEANRFTNGLTPELKKALLKEMAESRKGA